MEVWTEQSGATRKTAVWSKEILDDGATKRKDVEQRMTSKDYVGIEKVSK